MAEPKTAFEAAAVAKSKLSPFGLALATLLATGDANSIINTMPAAIRKAYWWREVANVYRVIGDQVVHLPHSQRLDPVSTVFALTSGKTDTIPQQLQPLVRQAITTTGLISWIVQGYHQHQVTSSEGGVWKWSRSPVPRLADVVALGLTVMSNPINGATNSQAERAVYESRVVDLLAANAKIGAGTAYL